MRDPAEHRDLILGTARRVIEMESEAVRGLLEALDEEFEKAVEMILGCKGRVVVTGVGKSGHVGRKIAATLASVGTPAFFMHAAEGVHGDLGMITADDVVIAISHSGSTAEVLALLPTLRSSCAGLIALTGRLDSPLAKAADLALDTGVRVEADPRGVAPTSSALATLALGDALALAVCEVKGFTRANFARFHPGGNLGQQLREERVSNN